MKKIISTAPFSDNVIKLIYDDGSVGFKGIDQGRDVLPTHDQMPPAEEMPPASMEEMKQMEQESEPMLRKYIDDLKKKKDE